MKLWIDDIRPAPDESWTVARTVTSAIEFVSIFGDSLVEISFDHDISYQLELNGVSRPYPSPETFVPVARYAALYYRGNEAKVKIRVHSANPTGGRNIADLFVDFPDVKVVPMELANRLESEV